MDIISFEFFVFCAVVIIIYAWLSRPAQNFWLLLASYGFYLTFGFQYVLFLLSLTWFNFWIGAKIANTGSAKKWLRVGVVTDVGLLIALKVITGPYGGRLAELLSGQGQLISILLPIGFSFYVLQSISYLVGIERRQFKPADHWVEFALYMAYFPKMLAGPIERVNYFLPQIEKKRKVDSAQFGGGVGLILLGLLRKMVIADGLSSIRPGDIFNMAANYSSLELGLWLPVFAFELYNDFAGYSNIVRGISKLLGIELSINFAQPFFANSFGDFWNRWHITLSSWLRDYIFFPLRRWFLQKKSPPLITLVFPPLITMFISGFWHGTSLAMLAWGALHGFYMVTEQVLRQNGDGKFRWPDLFSKLLIFILITLAWIPFGAGDLSRTLVFVRQATFLTSAQVEIGILVNSSFAVSFSFLLDWLESKNNTGLFFLEWSPGIQALVVTITLFILILFAGTGPNLSNFIYQGF